MPNKGQSPPPPIKHPRIVKALLFTQLNGHLNFISSWEGGGRQSKKWRLNTSFWRLKERCYVNTCTEGVQLYIFSDCWLIYYACLGRIRNNQEVDLFTLQPPEGILSDAYAGVNVYYCMKSTTGHSILFKPPWKQRKYCKCSWKYCPLQVNIAGQQNHHGFELLYQ